MFGDDNSWDRSPVNISALLGLELCRGKQRNQVVTADPEAAASGAEDTSSSTSEVGQAAQKAPHTSTVLHFVQQLVKRAEELEHRLSEADEGIGNQLLERKEQHIE
ncbi:hypothetical protein EYF80_045518 [Liparis tanakae]|uniref:Uncharacterized protein n=1 Tax=Liparis tanakae TaxID=230148 RepID=A0A4Z2FU30_9TELE|nr:hypothetical protein EYF80_045518 [Liparis tanakae]